ncbi:MAG: host attachment protein [Rhodospirillales bacterium]|nr:host attachment protein [Rhodospirillales bacterium]
MAKQQRLLVVIADGANARFLRQTPHDTLHQDRVFEAGAAHQRGSDLRSDGPGASFHSGSSAHHAIAPKHDPKELEKEKFAGFIAGEIDTAVAAETWDALVVVAPAHTMAVLREHLGQPARAILAGTVEKDLVKTPTDQLVSHLRHFIPVVLRPAE